MASKKNINDIYGITDDMLLQEINTDSQDLVAHLNQQIRELTNEKCRLVKNIDDLNSENNNLKARHAEERELLAGNGLLEKDAAASKILELSKNVRSLKSQLQSEKTRNCHISDKLKQLEKEVVNQQSKSITTEFKPQMQMDLLIATEKLKQAESKIISIKNEYEGIKRENKILMKSLELEIGNSADFKAALSNNSNWKGRAEQIAILQRKVDETKKELAMERGMPNRQQPQTSTKARKYILKLDEQKAMQIEKLQFEIEEKTKRNAEISEKYESIKLRNEMLGKEIKGLKGQMNNILTKSKHDDELIEALIKNQNKLKNSLGDGTEEFKEIKSECSRLQSKIIQLENSLFSLKTENEILKKQSQEKFQGTPNPVVSDSELAKLNMICSSLTVERDKLAQQLILLQKRNAELLLLANKVDINRKISLKTTTEVVRVLQEENDALSKAVKELEKMREYDVREFIEIADQARSDFEEAINGIVKKIN